jgi:hypothetical protein
LAAVHSLQAIGAHHQQARTARHLAVWLCLAAEGLLRELQLAGAWHHQHLLGGWHLHGRGGQPQLQQQHHRPHQGQESDGNMPACLLLAAAVASGVARAQGSNQKQQQQQQHSNARMSAAVQQTFRCHPLLVQQLLRVQGLQQQAGRSCLAQLAALVEY